MRIVSWNIHRCFGTDGIYSPERVLEVLKSFNADFIALQELDSSLRALNGTDQLRFFSRALGMESVMGPTLHRDYGAYGNVILSRREITVCEEYDLSFRRFEPRGALAIGLDHGRSGLRILNTHLGLKYWERAAQIDLLLAELVWRDGANVLLVGDFNEWLPFSANNLRLERAFPYRVPRVATFPSSWPRFALDRIFASGTVTSMHHHIDADRGSRVASDHLPLIAEVEFDEF